MTEIDKEQKRVFNTVRLMAVLDDWGLNSAEIIDLLALDGFAARHIERFRQGEALPDEPAINERMQHILGIADALRTTYPHNSKMGSIWMHTRQKKLKSKIPLQRIAEEGLKGLIAVRAHLDCTYAWDQSGSK